MTLAHASPAPAAAAAARSAAGYDRLARVYRWLERPVFGRRLDRARTALVDQVPRRGGDRVLILGDGDGRLLAELCRRWPDAAFTSVDQSAGMIAQQKRRVGAIAPDALARVTWMHADALSLDLPEAAHDLLVTAFFLDCFAETDLRRGLPRWLGAVRPGGHWLWVDFAEPQPSRAGRWRSATARALLACMHLFFRLQTACPNRRLLDWRPLPAGRPRRSIARSAFSSGLMEAELFELPDAAADHAERR